MRRSRANLIRSSRGFTLIEVALATAIIGVGVTALLMSVGAGTAANANGQKLVQATFLAQEVREWTSKLSFSDPDTAQKSDPVGPDPGETTADDLDDLKSATFNPPRDACGAAISDLPTWSQKITMTWRDPNDLSKMVADGASDFIKVQVDIYEGSELVLSTGWLVAKK